jgi:hypothetical protein
MRFQNEKLFTNQQTQKPKRNDRNSLQPNSPSDSQTIKTHNHSPSNTRHNTSPHPNNRSPRRTTDRRDSLKELNNVLSFFLVLSTKLSNLSHFLSRKCSTGTVKHYHGLMGCIVERWNAVARGLNMVPVGMWSRIKPAYPADDLLYVGRIGSNPDALSDDVS